MNVLIKQVLFILVLITFGKLVQSQQTNQGNQKKINTNKFKLEKKTKRMHVFFG